MVRRRWIVVFVTVLMCLSANALEVPERPSVPRPGKRKYLVYNVGLTSAFTLVSAIAQHQTKSAADAARQMLIGAGAGFSFYEAKRMTGAGRTTEGWLLGNVVASVVENTASGEHPFGRIGYTVGPVRFRVATGLARNANATIEADWSLAETGSLILARYQGDHIRLRHGLIAVDRDKPWKTSDLRDGFFYGKTFGVFPGLAKGHDGFLWQHEMVHVIQDLQFDSVEPAVYTFGGAGQPDDPASPRPFFAFRHVRLGFTYLLDIPEFLRPYQEHWNEIEAYGLAQRKPVPR